MAEIAFYATHEDCDDLWNFLFDELQLTAFPDTWFGNFPVPSLNTKIEVAANLSRYPRIAPGLGYFLTSTAWSIEPLKFSECVDNPNFAPFKFVQQRHGGPSIHFVPAFGYPTHKNPVQLNPGMISDYPTYYSVHGNKTIKRPAALEKTMTEIRGRLKSFGKTVRTASGKRAYAMKNAFNTLQQDTSE